ncbi:methyl-accepting chemotaxis protein [Ectopseudomonas oleovorans]|uniref:Methyl-accepting chemotaxis protein n=1 Tax=Ectopseudomonas oleovorans TaxID=301 RepID=A0AA42Q963_ECTOL|nr:PAS domain-containing methyl-accepting chemotaxis protein [Pseudomonas oleovorans]MDH1339310.1 methyl-accepting chemotaxis protein [Pseudomonas oleovorans]MDH1492552.1 methyl-accepting chemotaxis protein [Pseudomonas oleovorans]WGG21199.1 methyl-accepting chemotaxis protein [Pseudomonas oleovorans]
MTSPALHDAFREPPISRLDPQGVLLGCNAAYYAMCGYSEAELVGKPHELINHPDMPPAVVQGMWQALRSGMPWTGPMMGRHKNGSLLWHELCIVPLFDGGRLSALGTAYLPLAAESERQAERLYARLGRSQAAWRPATRLRALITDHGLALLLGAGLVGTQLLERLPWSWALPLLALLAAGSVHTAWQRRQRTQQLLARHGAAYCDPLLAPLHATQPGDDALLAMALNSQRVRMQTVMSRICINSEVLRTQAQTSAEVVESAGAQLDRQVRETEQAAAAINQMSATIQALSHNLHDTAQAAQTADQLARDGERLSSDSQASTDSMRASVEASATAVTELAQVIDSISGIAEVIQGIAEQTNLLALNAAIEAARAGESGRGFAVVADEVRSLALRTRESTREIQSSIASLRDGSSRALAAARGGEQAALRASTDVEQVRQALQHICNEVGQISGMSLQMAAAIEQQGQVAEQINQQISEIADVTEQSSQQAGRTREISQALHQLAESQLGLAQRFLNG